MKTKNDNCRFLNIPNEIFVEMMVDFCMIEDVINFSRSCKVGADICSKDNYYLWKQLSIRDLCILSSFEGLKKFNFKKENMYAFIYKC